MTRAIIAAAYAAAIAIMASSFMAPALYRCADDTGAIAGTVDAAATAPLCALTMVVALPLVRPEARTAAG